MTGIGRSRRLAIAIASLTISCASPPPSVPRCVQGSAAACSCSSGETGAQICNERGTFDACSCEGAPPRATRSTATTTSRPNAARADIRAVDWRNHRYRIDDAWIDVRDGHARTNREHYVDVVDVLHADLTGDGVDEAVAMLAMTACAVDCDDVMTREGLDIGYVVRVYTSRPNETEPHYIGSATVSDGEMRVSEMLSENGRIVIVGEPGFGLERVVYAVRGERVVEVERR